MQFRSAPATPAPRVVPFSGRGPGRGLARSLAPVLAALVLAPAAAAGPQEPLPQLGPGPYAVGQWDWDFGKTKVANPTGGPKLQVDHYGRLYYPLDDPTPPSGGGLPPVAAGGPFPLVVFGHGRFQTGPTLGQNHLEAGYLMERLASWGIVATSINLDVVGQFAQPAAIPQRGTILLNTVRKTVALDVLPQAGMPPGLDAAVDATRVGLLGHSRGGEGAVSAAVKWLGGGYPYTIVAVGTISPTDFEGYQLDQLPYLGLYGSKDGDVNNGWPIQLHDRATSPERIFEYVHGANHFWFTESISFAPDSPADISRELHHQIAMAYLGGFMVRKLAAVPEETQVFADGPELARLTDAVEILPLYRHPDRRVLDDFEANPDLAVSSGGERTVVHGFLAAEEQGLGSLSNQIYHLGRGEAVSWVESAGFWAHVADPPLDATPWTHLSVEFLQGPTSSLNATGRSQDVSLWILDADLDAAILPLSEFGDVPWPKFYSSGTFPKKRVFRTTRVPLSAFLEANPALDLDRVLATGWSADRSLTGELVFDDVEYTR